MKDSFSLMIHGGAGEVSDKTSSLSSIKKIAEVGKSLLSDGLSALDVVEHCVSLLENDSQFNAGKGSVLDERGYVEMDASIMEGKQLRAGAVIGVRNVKNPVKLARLVMEKTEYVLLAGKGANKFAEECGVSREHENYFHTDFRRKQWEAAQKKNYVVLDHTKINQDEKKMGTVGAVARDLQGDLAAATSTGGIVNKKFGRVGDSPIIGAGTYADNNTCAVSVTGYGEQCIRVALAKSIADIVRWRNCDAQTAAEQGIQYLVDAISGLGGVIVVDHDGNCGKAFSTPGMIYGEVQDDTDIFCGLE